MALTKFASLLLLAAAAATLSAPAVRAQELPSVALLVGNSDPVNRGDYMQDAMNGGVIGCGGSASDVQRVIASNADVFEGTLCTLNFFFVNNAVQGGTDELCSYDCVVEQALAGDFDLIIAVSFQYGAGIQAAALANPDKNFGIIDNAYSPTIPNVEVFIWLEDQAGFLAGVVAGEVAKKQGTLTLGAVGGIAIPPVKKFINGFAVGAQDVCPECPVYELYSQSFGSKEEGEAQADRLLEVGVDIAFCAGGFTGSSACKKLAENGVYVIGVDVDEYYTTFESGDAVGSEFILTSATKSTSNAVTFAIQCFLFNFEDCVGKNNLLSASNQGIALSPCHEACDVYDEGIQQQVADLFQALADNAISTGVDEAGDIIENTIIELDP